MERSSDKPKRDAALLGGQVKHGTNKPLPGCPEFYSALVEETQDLLCTHDFDGRLLSVSPAPARILGYEVNELLGMTLPELLVPEFRPLFNDYVAKIRREGLATGCMALLTRTGERRIWEYHNRLHTEPDGTSIVLGIAHDITERVQAEHALRASEMKFRSIFQDAPVGMVVATMEGRFLEVNEAFCQFLGFTAEELLGKNVVDVTHPSDLERTALVMHRALHQKYKIDRFQKRYRHQSGELRWGEVSSSLVQSYDGVSQYFIAQIVDVTERKHAEEQLRQKTQRLQTLWEVSLRSAAHLDLRALLSAVSSCLRRVLNQDFAGLFVLDKVATAMRPVALDLPAMELESDALIEVAERHHWNTATDKIELLEESDLRNDSFLTALLNVGIRSLCRIPLATGDGLQGTLLLGSNRDHAFSTSELELLAQVAPQVALAVANARAYEKIEVLKDKLAEEKIYLEEEIQSESRFDEIIGSSPALKAVLDQVSIVAPTEATVLITGETGTGKELIARAIHRTSSRNARSFIKVNCAAIPAGLLESELFGYERGAFTNASTRKIGRLELADQGTLFLDEVGELPLELQPKLLRVLEDHEFERLGSTKTTRVNARLIAATNRDLVQDVAQGGFRADLFFRLNVFPIRMMPLRDRRSDVPLLITYFVQKYAARMKKKIESIPKETMNMLTGWDWAGNVRELENFIERSVILTGGSVLQAPLAELALPCSGAPGGLQTNVEAIQRDQIVRALREAGGVIAGPTGAAARLGIKRTTLQSMVQRFGIPLEKYRGSREP